MTHESFDNTNLVENDLFAEWLGETRFTAQVMVDIIDCLALLTSKRVTLEEKMIRKELHDLIIQLGPIVSTIHENLAEHAVPQTEILEQLRLLNFSMRTEITRFLKALRYNFNYVEQYFEFDFCAKLREECRFSQEASEIMKNLLDTN
jgi:hypothetical protein